MYISRSTVPSFFLYWKWFSCPGRYDRPVGKRASVIYRVRQAEDLNFKWHTVNTYRCMCTHTYTCRLCQSGSGRIAVIRWFPHASWSNRPFYRPIEPLDICPSRHLALFRCPLWIYCSHGIIRSLNEMVGYTKLHLLGSSSPFFSFFSIFKRNTRNPLEEQCRTRTGLIRKTILNLIYPWAICARIRAAIPLYF